MELSRRSLLKAAAVSFALAVAGCSSSKSSSTSAKQDSAVQPDEWKKAVCRFCGTGCGVLCGVKDGKLVATIGDPDNGSNKGLNCVKGYYLGKIMYGEDRLTKPLIRDDKTTKGSMDGFREATWDEALDLVLHFGVQDKWPLQKDILCLSSGKLGYYVTILIPMRAYVWQVLLLPL